MPGYLTKRTTHRGELAYRYPVRSRRAYRPQQPASSPHVMLNEVNLRSDLKGIHPGCTNDVPVTDAQPPHSAPLSFTYTKGLPVGANWHWTFLSFSTIITNINSLELKESSMFRFAAVLPTWKRTLLSYPTLLHSHLSSSAGLRHDLFDTCMSLFCARSKRNVNHQNRPFSGLRAASLSVAAPSLMTTTFAMYINVHLFIVKLRPVPSRTPKPSSVHRPPSTWPRRHTSTIVQWYA